jgi:hypothetical protein
MSQDKISEITRLIKQVKVHSNTTKAVTAMHQDAMEIVTYDCQYAARDPF